MVNYKTYFLYNGELTTTPPPDPPDIFINTSYLPTSIAPHYPVNDPAIIGNGFKEFRTLEVKRDSSTEALRTIIPVYIDWEERVWEILRYHSNSIMITINLSPHFGVPFYTVMLTIESNSETSLTMFKGRNLWKRYRDIFFHLRNTFGKNMYIHNAPPLAKLD